MRKHMKLIVSIVALISLVAVMMIPAFAADAESGKLAVEDNAEKTTEKDGVKTLTLDAGTITWAGLGDMNVQDKSGIKQIGLGPAKGDDGKPVVSAAYIEFAFEVKTAGKYELTVAYSSKTDAVKNPNAGDEGKMQNRAAQYSVNGAAAKDLTIDQTSTDWNIRREVKVADVELVAGKNTVKFTNPADFDDNYIKSINLIDLSWTLTAADAPETDAPTTEAPTTDAPTTNAPVTGGTTDQPDAPRTGVATIALAIAAIGTGAYVVNKRKH